MSALGLGLGLGLSRARGGGVKSAIFTFTSRGSGADTGTLSLFYPASEHGKVVHATGNVKLGADGNLTEQVINGGATNTFIVTCSSGEGTLLLPNTYTRFSANTSDTFPTDGWVTSSNSPSLAFDIATLPIGLITFRCEGSNTISGNLPADWKLMTYFYCRGSNTISGNFPADWKSMMIFICHGSNTVSDNLPADWKSMSRFICHGSNTISGDLPSDWKSMTYFWCEGSNTISGNLPTDWKSVTTFRCEGSNTIDGITDGEYAGNLASTMSYLLLNSDNLGGLSTEDQESLLIGKASRTWVGTGGIFSLATSASMADTTIPGRWFDEDRNPTDVAVALKKLAIEKNVTVVLKGLTMPDDESGDGTGFPTGFGDWWRLP